MTYVIGIPTLRNVLVLVCFELMTSSLCSESQEGIELWLEDYTRSKPSANFPRDPIIAQNRRTKMAVSDAVQLSTIRKRSWDDSTSNTNDDIQADSPHGLNDEDPWEYECPVVPKDEVTKSTLLCLQPKCDTDLDCDWPLYKCCQNGCLQTCLEGVPPPP
ncbi:hypothetical protein LSH36_23g07001 [Paralvinella palmiformis]|uniref:WAP domain-containing protein n=1 Tax=Paralvinella palmiformis TaxID=53620 RepID=A0AAD9KBY2_9ANNE|nr:hypothetical protein LSH36_23g07001 [Paralvinella palmiformis]